MRVVPALDPLEHRHLGIRLALEAPPIEHLTFQGGEEALRHRVVVGVPDRSHRGHDTGFPAPLAEGVTGVLTAAIGVENDSAWLTLSDRHLQRIEDQLRLQVCIHRPAHNLAREHVQDHRQVQKAAPGRKWSERPGVVELFPGLSAPNRTCTFQRIRLSISSVAHSKGKISVTRFKDTALLFAQDVRVVIRQPPFELTLPARHQSPQRDFSEGSATIRTG